MSDEAAMVFDRFDRTEGERCYFGSRMAETAAEGERRKGAVTAICAALERHLVRSLWSDEAAQRSGEQCVRAWLEALQLLTGDESGRVTDCVAAFDRAWPTVGTSAPGPLESDFRDAPDDGLPDGAREGLKSIPQSLGAWGAYDLLCGLNDPSRVLKANSSAQLPALFDDAVAQVGRVAWLTVELFQSAASLFYPDPLKLGWTALPDGNHSFHRALQRVWHQGLWQNTSASRGRWSLTGYGPKSVFAAPSLTGRSLEAATACAILAAHSRLIGHSVGEPATQGTDQSPLRFVDELDDLATVSATLEIADTMTSSWSELLLGLVDAESLTAKLAAALNAGLHLVLLSTQQETFDDEHPNDDLPGTTVWYGVGVARPRNAEERRATKHVVIRRVATLGETYGFLCERNRWLRLVQGFEGQDFWKDFDYDETLRVATRRVSSEISREGVA